MRILIADDDATSRLVLKSVASRLGHECLVAEDGATAWEILSSEGVDVLLTDWMMPEVDGPELCRRVREELSGHHTYIVMITGLSQRAQVLEGMNSGADDYLIKPVDPFAVQTRLVAAERVTVLHRKVVDFQAQLERANRDLLELSLTDPLTGLGNRRRMEEDLNRAHGRALRSGRSYGIALFDIDHFKLYNDHYGHPAGDEALRQVARCLDEHVRSGESVYRYGGEEFLLLLPDCGNDDVAAAAERIRRVVTDMAMPHEARPSLPSVVTLSGGVTHWTPVSPLTVPDLLVQADEALFRAKSAGRNCVRESSHVDGDMGALHEAAVNTA
ncbi:MAG: diguanylate cyclase domain-containing protein [Acidimicrobiales bacterium]|jgi:two-component system chemotaxis response regulator CheY